MYLELTYEQSYLKYAVTLLLWLLSAILQAGVQASSALPSVRLVSCLWHYLRFSSVPEPQRSAFEGPLVP